MAGARTEPVKLVGAIAAIIVLLAGAVQVQAVRERRYPPRADEDESLYLRSGTAVRRLAGPLTTLAADVYWIRALQHYGGAKRRLAPSTGAANAAQPDAGSPKDYALLYPLLDIATTLDPRFKIAYRYGAIFLAEPYPSGPGRADLAITLLEKGLRAQPDKWEYMEDAGFIHYWYRHDYKAAAEWFNRAAALEGAPWWLRSLAATTLAQGGDRQSSRLMWRSIRESAEIDWLRRDADRRLTQLDAMDVIDLLQSKIREYVRRAGRLPSDWSDLSRLNLLPEGVPLDPTGTPFELGRDGVTVSRKSSLFPLPVDAPPMVRPPS